MSQFRKMSQCDSMQHVTRYGWMTTFKASPYSVIVTADMNAAVAYNS